MLTFCKRFLFSHKIFDKVSAGHRFYNNSGQFSSILLPATTLSNPLLVWHQSPFIAVN